MIVCNFTPDDVVWMHIGQRGKLKPGDIEEFSDARAAHILNKWGAKGVMRYDLKDDPEKKKAECMRLWTKFWMNQITTFNQQNEARKNEGKIYNFPTDELTEHAETLGIELVGPWKAVKQTDNKQVLELKAENEELKTQMGEMRETMSEMLELVKTLKDADKVPIVIETGDLIKRFISLDSKRFKSWVMEHAEEIAGWPKSVTDKAKEKWNTFYKDMDWPLPE
jgi:hypothetical protein